MGHPRITAIIPYYKGAKYIRQAVESVIEQTILPTELIIIDDGSPVSSGLTRRRLRGGGGLGFWSHAAQTV